MRSFVLGIAGGSGSGKSTLVEHLRTSVYRESITVLAHDAYYLDGPNMPPRVREQRNWDHPDALDNALFVAHLDTLLAGGSVEQPVYDFATHSRTERTVHIEARPVLLVEGILLLAIPEIRQRLDLRVFVDTPAEERLLRRMQRDIADRGRNLASVAEQFRSTVRPMHDLFVEPSRVHAHLIVPWDWQGDPGPAIAVLLARIGVAVGT
jgi:uridine kinase